MSKRKISHIEIISDKIFVHIIIILLYFQKDPPIFVISTKKKHT